MKYELKDIYCTKDYSMLKIVTSDHDALKSVIGWFNYFGSTLFYTTRNYRKWPQNPRFQKNTNSYPMDNVPWLAWIYVNTTSRGCFKVIQWNRMAEKLLKTFLKIFYLKISTKYAKFD